MNNQTNSSFILKTYLATVVIRYWWLFVLTFFYIYTGSYPFSSIYFVLIYIIIRLYFVKFLYKIQINNKEFFLYTHEKFTKTKVIKRKLNDVYDFGYFTSNFYSPGSFDLKIKGNNYYSTIYFDQSKYLENQIINLIKLLNTKKGGNVSYLKAEDSNSSQAVYQIKKGILIERIIILFSLIAIFLWFRIEKDINSIFIVSMLNILMFNVLIAISLTSFISFFNSKNILFNLECKEQFVHFYTFKNGKAIIIKVDIDKINFFNYSGGELEIVLDNNEQQFIFSTKSIDKNILKEKIATLDKKINK